MDHGTFSRVLELNRAAAVFRRSSQRAVMLVSIVCACMGASCGRTALSLSDPEQQAAGGSSGTAAGGQLGRGTAGSGMSGSRASGGASGGASGRAGTGGTGPTDCGARIDDMEDGSGRICTGSGRVGAWYAFNDHQKDAVQWPAETPPGTPIAMSLIPGSRGASTRGMHTFGTGFNYWGSGVGFDLNFDGTTYRTYDASRYQGVHFWARSDSQNRVRFRIGSESTTAVKYGGTCLSGLSTAPTECVGPAGVYLQVESEWHEYSVSFGELALLNERDRLTNIQFMTEGDFDFWVDDVSFLESAPNCCSSLTECQGGVRFADASLRRALAGSDAASAVLSCDLACRVRSVNLTDPTIQNLGGVECLAALDSLTLDTTQIAELTPLSGLSGLHELSLTNAQLSSLAPLEPLRDLRALTLTGNHISDLRPLAALTKLQSLNLSTNALTNIAPLANLTALSKLVLAANLIQDPSPVSRLAALKWLDLSGNPIANLGPRFQLPVLTYLDLNDNLLTDVTALAGLNALSVLYLNRNRVEDASPLAALGQLTILELGTNRITTPLGSLSNLQKLLILDLSHNQIATLGSVFGLPVLRNLDLGDNQLTEVSELAALTGIENLGLAHNSIHTLSGAFSFSNLQTLDLSSNGLTNIPEMSLSGSHVAVALLAHNQLQDLSAFAHVTFQLLSCDRCDASATLDVSDNLVRELTPLLGATWPAASFAKVILTGDPLDCTAQASNVQVLRTRGVTVTGCP